MSRGFGLLRVGSALVAGLMLSGCSAAQSPVPSDVPSGAASPGATASPAPGGSGSTPLVQPRSGPTAGAPPLPGGAAWSIARQVRITRTPWRLPVATSRGVGFGAGSYVVLAGGLGTGNVTTDRVLSIDVGTGAVRTLPALVTPDHDAGGAVLAGHRVVIGGGAGSELDVVQASGPADRWRTVGHLPGSRSDVSVVPLPDGALVIGGYDGRAASATVFRTGDGHSFTRIGRLRHPVRYAAATIDRHGVVWVIGGEDNGRELRWIQRVDPSSGRTSIAGRWPVPLGHAAALAVGDRILVLGGRTSPQAVTDRAWWFDPRTSRVIPADRLPAPVADAALALTPTAAYLLGGEGPAFRRDVLTLTPLP